MGEHLTAEQLARTGWKFHFNNDTIRGRRNVCITIPSNLASFLAYHKYRQT